jgi:GST-like protein
LRIRRGSSSAHHFRFYAPEKIPYAVDRYTNEAGRLYRVLDKRLGESPWLGGEDYTIADIATFPWLRSYERQGQRLEDYPSLARWFATVAERPAVQRGVEVLAEHRSTAPPTDEARENLFGARQFSAN